MSGNKRLLGLIISILPALYAQGQEFARRAALAPVPSSGFYQIPVTPELTGAAKADLSDMRILDEKQRQVPYLVRLAPTPLPGAAFTEYPILNIHTDTARTTVALAVKDGKGTDRVSLVMGNTAVERFSSLSGSLDGRQWFIIDDRLLLRSTGADGSGSFVQTLHFPLTTYPYLKLVIYNGATDPLNILKAGVYTDGKGQEPIKWTTNPQPAWVQKDSSDGYSYISIRHDAPYLVDEVLLEVEAPEFYNRRIKLYETNDKGGRNLLADGFLSSAGLSSIRVNSRKAATLLLQVKNGDNPPLSLKGLSTVQVPKYAVASLEEGVAYHLVAGNPDAILPQYDLAHFRDSIPVALATLGFGPLQVISKEEASLWQSKNFWLWPAIVVMIIAMGLLTFKLLRDMNRERENPSGT